VIATDGALARLAAGPLARAGGVAVFAGVPDALTCEALVHEAHRAYPGSSRQVLSHDDEAQGRGGMPSRALHTAGGGEVQDALYASPALHAFLSSQCGQPIVPSGTRGSYSYYVEPGDFLGLHLDVDTCDVTLITVLQDDTDPNDPGGGLAVFPGALGAPLGHVRASRGAGMTVVKARPGESIVILGGLVPHQVLPLGAHGQRVISALCFCAAPGWAERSSIPSRQEGTLASERLALCTRRC
jgi:hypothetical protein